MNVIMAFLASHATDYAAGLAFNAFLSIFPLVLGLVALIGLFPQSDEIKAAAEKVLVVAFPSSEQAAVLRSFHQARSSAGALALVSLAALLWSGTNLFASMEFAMDQIYLTATRPFWRNRLMGLAMLGVVLVAVGLLVAVSFLVGDSPAHSVVSFGLGAVLVVALLLVVYRFVPNRKSRFSELWPGALAAGVCIELLNLAFPTYERLTHGAATYGRTFGFLFVLGTWTYLLSLFLLFGALMNRMRLDRARLQAKDE